MRLIVNGNGNDLDVDPQKPLLRDLPGLTGSKHDCGIAQCGACMLHIKGMAVRACQIRLANIGGEVTV